MKTEIIGDLHGAIFGFIDTMPDGTLKAVDVHKTTLGYYDSKRNRTMDAHQNDLARGNILSALIWNGRH